MNCRNPGKFKQLSYIFPRVRRKMTTINGSDNINCTYHHPISIIMILSCTNNSIPAQWSTLRRIARNLEGSRKKEHSYDFLGFRSGSGCFI